MRTIISVGDVIMKAVAVIIGCTVLAVSGTAETAVAAPVASVAVQDSRDRGPSMDAPYYAVHVADDEHGLAADALSQVGAPADIEYAAYMAILGTGARGALNDGGLAAVYVKVGTVVDFGMGTVTVTNAGPAICIDSNGEPTDDGAPFPCTGREFLTAEWQAY